MVVASNESIVAACGGAALLLGLVIRPSLPLTIRALRPYAWIMSVFLVLGFRVSGGSLWDTLYHGTARITQVIENSNAPETATRIVQLVWMSGLDIMAILWMATLGRTAYCLFHYTIQEWNDMMVQSIYEWARQNVPAVRKEMTKQKLKSRENLKDVFGKDPNRTLTLRLPESGRSAASIISEMQSNGLSENKKWQQGQVSGAVYSHDDSHTQLMNAAYSSFSWANPLHPGMWPSVNQYEAEIISMTANLMGSQGDIVGTTTSGGTESIVLAIKAHREFFGRKRSIRHPELVCGPTAHAAVDKACEILGIRKVTVACDSNTHTLVPKDIEKQITCNTIMIYSSAPSYPQGVIDPIDELSKIALKYDIGLHVDACLGGFVLPFARKLGRCSIPKFDFECPGVTSMSVDTHKFAYASKGTSVVLYRHDELRHAQYFSYAKWTGGMYSTPTIAGSRPGALLACAWAAMISIGESGYLERVTSILDTSAKLVAEINKMDDIYVLGSQTPTMVVCFASNTVDIYRVGDMMEKRGWSLNALQHPASVHICVTLNTVAKADKFVSDLFDSVNDTRKEGAIGKTKGSAAIYGMSGSLPAGPVNELLCCYTDMTLTP